MEAAGVTLLPATSNNAAFAFAFRASNCSRLLSLLELRPAEATSIVKSVEAGHSGME